MCKRFCQGEIVILVPLASLPCLVEQLLIEILAPLRIIHDAIVRLRVTHHQTPYEKAVFGL